MISSWYDSMLSPDTTAVLNHVVVCSGVATVITSLMLHARADAKMLMAIRKGAMSIGVGASVISLCGIIGRMREESQRSKDLVDLPAVIGKK